MKYVIEEKMEFQILAASRIFSEETAKAQIPQFWQEYYGCGYGDIACGQYGVCCGGEGAGKFRYAIGNACRVEKCADGSLLYHVFNCPDRKRIPAGFELLTIPAATWAAFECLGPLPHSIQNMWPRIYNEWLPVSGYEKVPGFELEEYGRCETASDAQKADYRCVIRIPVRRVGSRAYSVRLNELSAADFVTLYRSPGWEAPPEEQVRTALQNSLAVFSVHAGDMLIGMGRLIGDRSMAYMVRDVVILPAFQRCGAGSFLMRAMLEWIAHDLPAGWRGSCELFAAQGKSEFYQKFGFEPLPNPYLENGLMRMVDGVK